jgi:orotate phosphoribosyltransferase
MVKNRGTAIKTAQHLLQIKAIKLQPQAPFTWSSGWQSPIYCDNRITLSHPSVRDFLKKTLAEIVHEQHGHPDAIAGVATGAIGIGALVADLMHLPFVYVRPEKKKHGRQNQIEGELKPISQVVVVEDLISTGKSSINAVKAIRDAGSSVLGMVSLFDYGFAFAKANLQEAEVKLTSLSDYQHLLEASKENNQFTEEELKTLEAWRKDPANWKKN